MPSQHDRYEDAAMDDYELTETEAINDGIDHKRFALSYKGKRLGIIICDVAMACVLDEQLNQYTNAQSKAGAARSQRKAEAARVNGRLGGRPRTSNE
jgi:hypothetical protein